MRRQLNDFIGVLLFSIQRDSTLIGENPWEIGALVGLIANSGRTSQVLSHSSLTITAIFNHKVWRPVLCSLMAIKTRRQNPETSRVALRQ